MSSYYQHLSAALSGRQAVTIHFLATCLEQRGVGSGVCVCVCVCVRARLCVCGARVFFGGTIVIKGQTVIVAPFRWQGQRFLSSTVRTEPDSTRFTSTLGRWHPRAHAARSCAIYTRWNSELAKTSNTPSSFSFRCMCLIQFYHSQFSSVWHLRARTAYMHESM